MKPIFSLILGLGLLVGCAVKHPVIRSLGKSGILQSADAHLY